MDPQRAPPEKVEEFRAYLQEQGVNDFLMNAVSELYTAQPRPRDALSFLRESLDEAVRERDTSAATAATAGTDKDVERGVATERERAHVSELKSARDGESAPPVAQPHRSGDDGAAAEDGRCAEPESEPRPAPERERAAGAQREPERASERERSLLQPSEPSRDAAMTTLGSGTTMPPGVAGGADSESAG